MDTAWRVQREAVLLLGWGRAILLQLGCHSQLEALAAARKNRLLPDRMDQDRPGRAPIV